MKMIATAAAAVLVLSLAACGNDDDTDGADASRSSASPGASATSAPSEPAAEGVTVDIEIAADGKVTPQGKRVDVKVGQEVTLNITAAADEEIHVHSDPEHEYEVAAGDEVSESFTLETPGQVAVEAHHADAVIAQLVVRP
ncbi:hypothetical protein ASD11_12985 [Aeromicrobium sp. Root495]|uniref:hypothetical protein n=1 Tax=Aeromicrobium sp. Root495 TaxID=1736550 RepID=UPI0006F3EB1E|nr:hypothetical protein [Aeromicrobium sp. Root495]KQY60360.1 hypothetical protein ASD11_12985 [Aeromicrobium sp. Root495]